MLQPSNSDVQHSGLSHEDLSPSHTNILLDHKASSSLCFLESPKLIRSLPEFHKSRPDSAAEVHSLSESQDSSMSQHMIMMPPEPASSPVGDWLSFKQRLEGSNPIVEKPLSSCKGPRLLVPNPRLPSIVVQPATQRQGRPKFSFAFLEFENKSGSMLGQSILSSTSNVRDSPDESQAPSMVHQQLYRSESSNISNEQSIVENIYFVAGSSISEDVIASTYRIPSQVDDHSQEENKNANATRLPQYLAGAQDFPKRTGIRSESGLSAEAGLRRLATPDFGNHGASSKVPLFKAAKNPFLRNMPQKRDL